MGWIGTSAFTDSDRCSEILHHCGKREETESMISQIIKVSAVGTTVYAAMEDIEKESGKRTVSAVVFPTAFETINGCHDFYYKWIGESAGPNENECPACILKLLTPTDSEWANHWRKECWENVTKRSERIRIGKLPVGTKIRTDVDTYTKTYAYTKNSRGRRELWIGSNGRYNFLTRILKNEYTVIQVGETR